MRKESPVPWTSDRWLSFVNVNTDAKAHNANTHRWLYSLNIRDVTVLNIILYHMVHHPRFNTYFCIKFHITTFHVFLPELALSELQRHMWMQQVSLPLSSGAYNTAVISLNASGVEEKEFEEAVSTLNAGLFLFPFWRLVPVGETLIFLSETAFLCFTVLIRSVYFREEMISADRFQTVTTTAR